MNMWDKNISTEERILVFTTGKDPMYDLQLAPYDVLGSMAHAIMLAEVGLIEKDEAGRLIGELVHIYEKAEKGELELEPGMEDIHSQVEMMLTSTLGDLGKRIHTGRSRNDQVMVDIKLFLRDQIGELAKEVLSLGKALGQQAESNREVLIPGYTHMQVAMPSSFGLWFGAYAEALADDLKFLLGIHSVVNQNPLGSAAGFGSSFPVDRELTTRLLSFEDIHVSSVNAQMNRGKTEWYVATGISAVASTIARLAMDAVLFMGQNFNFLSLPEELTTGSSIMPHKKNPDVLELLRARCNRLSQIPSEITAVTGNLISGYHRDFQILKEILHPALEELKNCLLMMQYVVERIIVKKDILEDPAYQYIYSVEEVNKKVKEGIPFRDAYREVAEEIDKDRYRPGRDHSYTHLGSIGNPGIAEIMTKLELAYGAFRFVDTSEVVDSLSNYYMKS
ncbi:MAG: argininosuccinate lyase [Bacteroidales bacterium]|nr:argininosuccinate lyase [Bacteroidales bacterium]